MGTLNVFLGPTNTGQSSADYTLEGWSASGTSLVLTAWSWTETGCGGYVISHANLIPGCTYWLRKTAGGTPWTQGAVPYTGPENTSIEADFTVFLGTTVGPILLAADYTLEVWDTDGVSVDTSGWSWTPIGSRGQYRITVPAVTDSSGITYDLRATATGTPWTQGQVPYSGTLASSVVDFTIFLGPSVGGSLDAADYFLEVWDVDGVAVDPTGWSWSAKGTRGQYRISVPALTTASGITYDLRHTIAGTPWTQGAMPIITNIAGGGGATAAQMWTYADRKVTLDNTAHGGAAATLQLSASPQVSGSGTTLATAGEYSTINNQFFIAAAAGGLACPQGWDWRVASSPSASYSVEMPAGAYILAHYIVPGSGSNPEIFRLAPDGLGGSTLTNILAGEVYNSSGTFLQLEICPGSSLPFPAGTLTIVCGNTVLGEQPQTITISVPQIIYCDNYYVDKAGVVIPPGGHNIVPAAASSPSAIAAAVLAAVVEGSLTIAAAVRILLSANAGKCSGMDGTSPKFRDIGDTKDRIAATVDKDGNRTAVTLDGSV